MQVENMPEDNRPIGSSGIPLLGKEMGFPKRETGMGGVGSRKWEGGVVAGVGSGKWERGSRKQEVGSGE
jgi:hypothetical protein